MILTVNKVEKFKLPKETAKETKKTIKELKKVEKTEDKDCEFKEILLIDELFEN